MDGLDRWHVLGLLGEGGQGKVYRVVDKHKFDLEDKLRPKILKAIRNFSGAAPKERQHEYFDSFQDAIVKLIQMNDASEHAALKTLHSPEYARGADRAEKRMIREIRAMSSMTHPNLLQILDSDPKGRWYVSKFYERGTLADSLEMFKGNTGRALRAFRGVVEGVCELHKNELVHRDIKPQNIFIGDKDTLVLGDFGLIFYDSNNRMSATYENVGTRDWMPGWAYGLRLDDVKSAFDVFSLGKLLWSMISGRPILQLWYFNRSPFNLEELFPGQIEMRVINQLLGKCVVEFEQDCLGNAMQLLDELDRVISIIDAKLDIFDPSSERKCRVCSNGHYKLVVNRDPIATRNFGFNPHGTRSMKVFCCDYCGNVQMFSFNGEIDPEAWRGE